MKFRYRLPMRGLPVGISQPSICRNALCGMLYVGRKLWKTAMKDTADREHALKGKMDVESGRGKEMAEVYQSLHSFFTEVEDEALPFAMRLLRDETGTNTRDDNVDDVVLPPHVTKHSLYARWCYSRGWKVEKKSSAKTIMKSTKEYTKRDYEPVDEDGISLFPPGSEYGKVISWPSFLRYWKRNFGHVKLRKKGADICTDCLIIMNDFRSCQRRRAACTPVPREGRDADEDGAEEDDSSDSDMDISSSDDDDDDDDEDTVDDNEAHFERAVEQMRETTRKGIAHVRAYQIQRDESKRIISLARNDIANHLPSLFRRKVLTIDMGQNLNLPNFEGEQPGDTYYLSPLTVLLFGVVNNATEDGMDRMNAYTWQEFEGDRGANNIASCLLKDLKIRGWLNQPNHSELTYIADNCGGQNKNKVVIRFLMWLVEVGIFPQIKIFFLVKGHTKNAADRLFNLLKLSYHRKNLYTYDVEGEGKEDGTSLYKELNANEYVNVTRMRKEDFHDHLQWQDKYFRTPTLGEFKQSHVFTIYGNARHKRKPTILVKQDDAKAVFREDDLAPTRASRKAKILTKEERMRQLKRMQTDLKQLVPTALRPIKQVELWKKWSPLIPDWARPITCPKPSDEVINSIKVRNRKKTQERTAGKKRRKMELQVADKNSKNSGDVGN